MGMKNQIIISDTFFDSIWKLDKRFQRKVQNSIKRFAEDVRGNGFQVHDLDRINCDPSFRSARIDQDLRLIFSQQSGNTYLLLYVGHHDDAYQWAEGKFLEKSKFGSLYVSNSNVVEQRNVNYDLNYHMDQGVPSILSVQGIKSKDLLKLGVQEELADHLLQITDEDDLILAIADLLPELQEALLDLATGTKSMTEVYAELTDEGHSEDDGIEHALTHKDSKRRFYVLEDAEELEELLDGSNEKWKWFLHPKQENLVRANYHGPVLIEGGPGTGKTVVAIHRAVHLAKEKFPDQNDKILICTFSKKLATYLKKKVDKLARPKKVDSRIDVLGVDAYLYSLAKKHNLLQYEIDPNEVRNIIQNVYQELKPQEPISFYQREYEEIIQGKCIRSWDEYRKVSREGLGKALHVSTRKKVWPFFERVIQAKKASGVIDFEDLALIVVKGITNGVIPPQYASIIIDEAQDLSSVKLRALSLLAYGKSNNLMILSDQNQRVFRMSSWRASAKIDIVGRTQYLSLNYRTTKQIREYADLQFIETQMVKDHIREYKSLLSGPEPQIQEFGTNKAQYDYLINLLKNLLTRSDLQLHDICIITPSESDRLAGILEYEDLPFVILRKNTIPGDREGICISSLQGCKGLEFRIVIMVNYEKISSFSNQQDDYYDLKNKQQIECMKYVAITRAREELYITYVEQNEVD